MRASKDLTNLHLNQKSRFKKPAFFIPNSLELEGYRLDDGVFNQGSLKI